LLGLNKLLQSIKQHNYSHLPHTASIHWYTRERVLQCGALHSFLCTVVYFTTMSVYQDSISSAVGSLVDDEQMDGLNNRLFRSTTLALSWSIWIKPRTCQDIQCSGRFSGQTPQQPLSRS